MEFIGRNTLSILLFHFFVLMTTHVIFHKIQPNANNYAFPHYLFHFITTTIVCMGLAWCVDRFCPWLLKFPKKMY